MRDDSRAGFTLIEILVVMVIISIVTSVALFTVSRNENKQLESFANELVQIVGLAEEQAMLQPSVFGLSVNKHSFSFASYQPKSENEWRPLEDKIFGKHSIPHNIHVELKMHDQAEGASPRIVFSTNGDITPFTIYVGKKGQQPRYAVRGDADGKVTSQLLT